MTNGMFCRVSQAQCTRSLQSVGSVARMLFDDPAAPDGDHDAGLRGILPTVLRFGNVTKLRAAYP